LSLKKASKKSNASITERFSETEKVLLAADELPLNEFLHYVMGEVLKVSYILGDDVKNDVANLTLNLQQSVSHRKLFSLVEDLLAERGYIVRFNDSIYYVNQEGQEGARKNISFGYGNKAKDVPFSAQEIWQLAPFDYGFNGTLQLTLSQLAKVRVYPDQQQNLFSIRGKRAEIIKALEFMNLVDKPRFKNRKIAMYKTVFSDADIIIKKLADLLKQEGISLGSASDFNQAVSIVPLPSVGAFTLFANKQEIINRALFWARQIDQPQQGSEIQYFIYAPQFSRAADLGESLNALLGGTSTVSDKTSAKSQNKQVKNNVNSTGVSASDIGLVVDERANSLIFQTTGAEYKKLLPLIKRLDVMPKQIMLEVLIAEVTMTDEFKMGVEYAFNNGNYSMSTEGALGLDKIGGISYVLKGVNDNINLNMFEGSSLVNVLSRPSVVVRDGVAASMSVGTDIPIIGETSQDPIAGEKQTTKIEYRKTGVELTVTPTVNAQGVVIMEIEQKISNELEVGSTVVSSPSIFERNISTEVVAQSGQTIILGGLISDNTTNADSKVPFFGDLPIIGNLFKAQTQSGSKTELVIMVTPRVIESSDEWQSIKQTFLQGLEQIELDQ
jgi:general secretion pathway protein D